VKHSLNRAQFRLSIFRRQWTKKRVCQQSLASQESRPLRIITGVLPPSHRFALGQYQTLACPRQLVLTPLGLGLDKPKKACLDCCGFAAAPFRGWKTIACGILQWSGLRQTVSGVRELTQNLPEANPPQHVNKRTRAGFNPMVVW